MYCYRAMLLVSVLFVIRLCKRFNVPETRRFVEILAIFIVQWYNRVERV